MMRLEEVLSILGAIAEVAISSAPSHRDVLFTLAIWHLRSKRVRAGEVLCG